MGRKVTTAAGLVMAGVLAAGPAQAEVQTETIVAEQRTSVSVRISPEAAQAFMPTGWTPNAPSLTLIFMDRKLQLTPEGKPLQSGANRLLVLSMAGKNTSTGEIRSLIVGGYSADPLGVPGAYKVYAPGQVTVARTERSEMRDARPGAVVEERWAVQAADGASVNLDVTFTRGLPTFASFEQKIHSGAEPDFYRIYRGQQASEVLRAAAGPDRVQSISLKASGGKLGAAVNGSQQILSVSSAPFYSRQTFVK